MNINNFVFPAIDYSYWCSQHGDNDEDSLGLGLTSRLLNLQKDNPTISMEVIQLNSMADAVVFIEAKIAALDKQYQDYLDVFDAINNWGGKTIQRGIIYSGRTLRNNLSYNNWFANYIEAANLLRQEGGLIKGIEQMFQTPGLGVSFGSKHIAFWTFDNPATAIYDSKISQILLRSRNPHKNDLIPFLNSIRLLCQNEPVFCSSLNPKELEKALFAFHKNYWSNSGEWAGREFGHDFLLAFEWNERLSNL